MKTSLYKLFKKLFFSFLLSCSLVVVADTTNVLFYTNFPSITEGNNTNHSESSQAVKLSDLQGFADLNTVYKAGGAIKIGKSNSGGFVTTTNMVCALGKVYVEAKIKGWTTKESDFVVQFGDLSPQTIPYTAVMADDFEKVSTEFNNTLSGEKNFIFKSNNKRLFVDEIKIYQVESANASELDTPQSLTIEGEVLSDTFTVSWDAVQNAESYTVSLEKGSIVDTQIVYTSVDGFPVVVTGTSYTFDVEDNSYYRVKVMANTTNPLYKPSNYSTPLYVETPLDADKPIWDVSANVVSITECETVEVQVSATVNGESVSVIYESGIPTTSNSPTFTDGAFNWVTDVGDAGSYALTFVYQAASKRYEYIVNVSVAELPPLQAVLPTVTEINHNSVKLIWNDTQVRTSSYDVKVWTSSTVETDFTYDTENFYNVINDSMVDNSPNKWMYSCDSSDFYTTEYRMKFTTEGDVAISKLYPAALSEIKYGYRGNKGGSLLNNSVVTIYATRNTSSSISDIAIDEWVQISTIEVASGSGVRDNVLPLDAAENYRRVKFELTTKGAYNVGIGPIAAKYEGSGVNVVLGEAEEGVGVQVDKSTNELLIDNLHVNTEYVLRFDVNGRTADEVQTKYLRFETISAPVATLIVVQ